MFKIGEIVVIRHQEDYWEPMSLRLKLRSGEKHKITKKKYRPNVGMIYCIDDYPFWIKEDDLRKAGFKGVFNCLKSEK